MNTGKRDIESYLCDTNFIEWVLSPTSESDAYWNGLMDADLQVHQDIKKSRAIILSIKFNTPVLQANVKKTILNSVLHEVDKGTSIRNRQREWLHPFLKIAALILLTLSVVYVSMKLGEMFGAGHHELAEVQITKHVRKGEKLILKLPDKSRVWVNSDSKLSYNESFGKTDRTLYLEGEAFFEVACDSLHPFVVVSHNVMTKATGTKFNVNARPEQSDIEIALLEGKVEVSETDHKQTALILEPEEKAVFNKKTVKISKTKFDIEKEMGWKRGVIYFETADFEEVMQTLERWYGVRIYADDVVKRGWCYTAKFEDQSLELILKRMAYTENFEFTMYADRKEVFITTKK